MLMVEPTTRGYSKGFTLTEMVIALALFGIISVSIVNTIGLTQQAQRNERYLDLANTTAKQIIEEARNGQYTALTASTAGISYDRAYDVPSELPNGYANIVVSQSTTMPDFKRVDVTVGYKIGTLDRHVNESAIIGLGGITQ